MICVVSNWLIDFILFIVKILPKKPHWTNNVTWPKMKIYQILCMRDTRNDMKQYLSHPKNQKFFTCYTRHNFTSKMKKMNSVFVTFSFTHRAFNLRWYCLWEVYCIILLHWRWSATRVWLPQWDYGCWQLYKHGDRAFVRSSITMFFLSFRMGKSFH